MKAKFRIICLILVFSIILSNPVMVFGSEKSESFQVSIMPNTTVSSPSMRTATPISMTINLADNTYLDESVVACSVHVNWPTKNWDAVLNGTAYIHNKNNDIVILGSVSGFNGPSIPDNFVGIDFTYGIKSGNCIATATYEYDANSQCSRNSFGNNTGEFNEAQLELVTNTRLKENVNTISSHINTNFAEIRSIDTATVIFGSQNYLNGTVNFKVWSRKELSPDGNNWIDATVFGNVSSAEPYIIAQEPTATGILPTTCRVYFAGGSNVKFSQTEMIPNASHRTIEFTIPLPAGQSTTIPITISSIITGLSNSSHTTYWELFDRLGLENIGSAYKYGFENEFHFLGSVPAGGSASMSFQCTASIGYHYIYTDTTGNLNNSTWYPMAIVTGSVTCVN